MSDNSHFFFFFFFNDTATTEIYTLSLHDALPIWASSLGEGLEALRGRTVLIAAGDPLTAALALIELDGSPAEMRTDRKSTRLNSSHLVISYAVFCLKKKKKNEHKHSKRT